MLNNQRVYINIYNLHIQKKGPSPSPGVEGGPPDAGPLNKIIYTVYIIIYIYGYILYIYVYYIWWFPKPWGYPNAAGC
jgi:hypothetical protein